MIGIEKIQRQAGLILRQAVRARRLVITDDRQIKLRCGSGCWSWRGWTSLAQGDLGASQGQEQKGNRESVHEFRGAGSQGRIGLLILDKRIGANRSYESPGQCGMSSIVEQAPEARCHF